MNLEKQSTNLQMTLREVNRVGEGQKNVPKLRFKGYEDAWEQRKFSEIALRSTVQESSRDFPSVEYEDVIAEAGRLNKDVNQKEAVKKGIVFDGSQVLYGKLRPYLHNWLSPDFSGVAVGDWWVLKPIKVDKSFLYRLIQTQQFDDIANQSAGSKMPRADWNLVSNSEFSVPVSGDEQSKIGGYFSSLDTLITLHQRKYDALKSMKKTLLSKMFPKNGEDVPEIRFKEFTDAWEQRKLGEVIRLNGRIGFRGYTEKDIVSKNDEGVLTFSPTNIVDNKLTTNCKNTYITRFKYDESPEIKIHNGDILFVKTGSTLGKSALVTELSEDATLNPQVVVMRSNNLNVDFLAAMLVTNSITSQVNSSKIGGAVPTLTEMRIKDFDVAIPVSETEGEQIGHFFRQLDGLITLHQRKLEELKNMKKTLLQQMFV